MPLRKLLNQTMLSPEDADLLESLFNQFSAAGEAEQLCAERASGLVKLFVDGERDQQKLAAYLMANPTLADINGPKATITPDVPEE